MPNNFNTLNILYNLIILKIEPRLFRSCRQVSRDLLISSTDYLGAPRIHSVINVEAIALFFHLCMFKAIGLVEDGISLRGLDHCIQQHIIEKRNNTENWTALKKTKTYRWKNGPDRGFVHLCHHSHCFFPNVFLNLCFWVVIGPTGHGILSSSID